MSEAIEPSPWQSAGLSDTGKLRQINEDALLDRSEAGLWVVADGMGGHEAGDFASSLIIERLAAVELADDLLDSVQRIQETLQQTNRELLDEARQRGSVGTIGSTLAALLVQDGQCACLWAGDSRVYRLRSGILQAMTRDHSVVEDLIEQGLLLRDDAESHPDANIITRAVGALEELDIEVVFDGLHPGDRYLLCSDGLYKELSTRDIGNIMQFGGDCQSICRDLIDDTLARGAQDNVTVVTVEIERQADV